MTSVGIDVGRLELACHRRECDVWAERDGSRIVLRVHGDPWPDPADDFRAPFVIVESCPPIAPDAESAQMPMAYRQREQVRLDVLVIGKKRVLELLEPKEVIVTEQKNDMGLLETTRARISSAIKEEAKVTMWMVAARKAIDQTAPLSVDALLRGKIIGAETANAMKTWLAQDVGSGVYGYVAGTLLTMHPKAAKRAWLAELAKHMRLEGGARIVGVVVDPILKAVEAVLLGAVEDSGIAVDEKDQR